MVGLFLGSPHETWYFPICVNGKIEEKCPIFKLISCSEAEREVSWGSPLGSITPQNGDLLKRLITCFLPFTKWDDLPNTLCDGSLVCAHPLFGAGIVGTTPGADWCWRSQIHPRCNPSCEGVDPLILSWINRINASSLVSTALNPDPQLQLSAPRLALMPRPKGNSSTSGAPAESPNNPWRGKLFRPPARESRETPTASWWKWEAPKKTTNIHWKIQSKTPKKNLSVGSDQTTMNSLHM